MSKIHEKDKLSMDFLQANLKTLRDHCGMTQGEFGKLFGLSRDNIASYERGTMPSAKFYDTVLKMFQIPSGILFSDWLVDHTEILYNLPLPVSVVNEPEGSYTAGPDKPMPPLPPFEIQEICLYEFSSVIRLTSFLEEPDLFEPVDTFTASSFPRLDGAMGITGKYMDPVLESGDVIFYRNVNEIPESLLWGELYLIVSERNGEPYVVAKYILESDIPGHVALADSPSGPTVQQMEITRIKKLLWIRMSLRKHGNFH